MRSHTLYASALQPGDHIIGDRMYPRGLLDLLVTEVTKTRLDNSTKVTIKVETGSDDTAIDGTITYDGDDSVTVASLPDHDTRGSEGHDLDSNLERRLRLRGHLPPASDPFVGLGIPTNDGWDAS